MAALLTVMACGGGDQAARWPEVTVEDLATGRPVPSTSVLGVTSGRPTVVTVWAVWCEPCRHELPVLDELARERADSLAVAGINHGDDPLEARGFLEDLGVDLASLRDPDGRLVSALGVVSLPATFVVDGDGRIAWQRLGVVERAEVEAAVDAVVQSSQRPIDG